MASRHRYLVCFYCNKRSNVKYDGCMSQWECAKCEAVNYLDEQGEITDPPVATEYAAPADVQYALSRNDSSSPQPSESSIFCATCIKNQRLFTASLQQYHVELDTSHPRYKKLQNEYFNYRAQLEKRYPQVCEDCEPRVLERMGEASQTAKSDYLRRLMEKSRQRKYGSKMNGLTVAGCFEFAGKTMWHLGLLGQFFWHTTAITAILQHAYPAAFNVTAPHSLDPFLRFLERGNLLSFPANYIWMSLMCSVFSFWWNPRFMEAHHGFMNHIKGYWSWYQYAALMLVVRGVFYLILGTKYFADPFAPITGTAHTFTLLFLLYLAYSAQSSLKVDMTPLWSVPEKIRHVGPSTGQSPPINGMAEILDETGLSSRYEYGRRPPIQEAKPKTLLPRYVPGSLVPMSPHYDAANMKSLYLEQGQSSSNRFSSPGASTSPFVNPTRFVNTDYPGAPPATITARDNGSSSLRFPSLDSPTAPEWNEQMDWQPTQTKSQHRAFEMVSENSRHPFGQTPIENHFSTFWYKVPPPPTTPAQRLRNPPNQPRLRVSSQEVKQNLFGGISREPVSIQPRHDVDFRQQTFFPVEDQNDELADMLTTFSINTPEAETSESSKHSYTVFGLCMTALLGLFIAVVTLYKTRI